MTHPQSKSSEQASRGKRRRPATRRATLPGESRQGLEGLCVGDGAGDAHRRRDRLQALAGAPGVERLLAELHGQAYAPHRHDSYALGLTLAGVQSFRFRGRQWQSLPGQAQILHPDELHDGVAGSDAPFVYRAVYLDPAVVQEALAGAPLPFVAEPVVELARLPPALAAAIWDPAAELDELGRADLISAVAALLRAASGGALSASGRLALAGLERVRERLSACPGEVPVMAELEALAGLDRWSLARQFRAAYGTSPSRFRLMRRLDLVRRRLRQGATPAEAAYAAGFADQAHMTRQFKAAWGLTPGRWAAAQR